MKCWECKKEITRAVRVCYTDSYDSKFRDVCEDCYTKIKFNPCHIVEVDRITQTQLKIKRCKKECKKMEAEKAIKWLKRLRTVVCQDEIVNDKELEILDDIIILSELGKEVNDDSKNKQSC